MVHANSLEGLHENEDHSLQLPPFRSTLIKNEAQTTHRSDTTFCGKILKDIGSRKERNKPLKYCTPLSINIQEMRDFVNR